MNCPDLKRHSYGRRNRAPFVLLLVCWLGQTAFSQNSFWTQTNGPFGGAVWALASDSNGDLYCGARSGTIFRYSSKKASWLPLFIGATRQDIVSMVADGKGHLFFAAANESTFVGYPKTNSWKKLEGGPKAGEVSTLAIDPGGSLLAGSRSGLFRFDLRGEVWTRVAGVESVFGIRVQGEDVYTFGTAIFHSSNGGRTWNRLSAPDTNVTTLAKPDSQTTYVGTRTGDVFLLEKGDRDWMKVFSFPGNAVSSLEIDGQGKLYVALRGPAFSSEGGGLYVVRPGEVRPELLFEDNSNGVPALLMHRGGLMVGTNEGVWRSTDGGSKWTRFNNGLIAQRINDIVIDHEDVIYAGSYGGVFRSVNNGKTWSERNKGLEKDIGILDMAVNRSGHLFVGTYLSNVYRSTNAGASWHKLKTGIPKTAGNWIMNLVVNRKNHVFACVLEGGLYRSLDNGDTWEPVAAGVFTKKCHALVVDSRNRVYSANSNGDLYRSDDDGARWQRLPASSSPVDHPSELAVDRYDRIYFGGSQKGVFRFSEEDNKWKPLNRGLPNTSIRSLLFIGDSLFIGTSGANNYELFDGNDIFQSADGGTIWMRRTSGLKHPRIKALEANSKGILFAGTWGAGVYKSTRPASRPQ